MNNRFAIELTETERSICDQIEMDALKLRGPETANRNADSVMELLDLLDERSGIPQNRIAYFTDPEFNQGNHGRSRQQGFERNGCRGSEILRHPHFLKYLKYFLFGADLPSRVIASFVKTIDGCGTVSSGDITELSTEARRLTRLHRLESRTASDEFFKLAIDCDISPWMADSIRTSVRSVRLR